MTPSGGRETLRLQHPQQAVAALTWYALGYTGYPALYLYLEAIIIYPSVRRAEHEHSPKKQSAQNSVIIVLGRCARQLA